MASSNSATVLESLAAEIGEAVYLDIAKWHLYLSDARLHETLAKELYELMIQGSLNEKAVGDILQQTSIKIGGGRRELPLADFIPMSGQIALMDILERFQREI
jgi:hypothetical protein